MDIARQLHLQYNTDHPGRIKRGCLIISKPDYLSWTDLPQVGTIEDYDLIKESCLDADSGDAQATDDKVNIMSNYCIIS